MLLFHTVLDGKKARQEIQTYVSGLYSPQIQGIELLSKYKFAKSDLKFVADWLVEQRNTNGKWDMGKIVNDKVYFPLSDDWRRQETREADCTERVDALLKDLLEW